MTARGSVGSLVESHRAEAPRPDQWNFLPQNRLLLPAAQFSELHPQSDQSAAKKATGVKATDAADAYEHILTIQNAADLEFPATDPANAPARAEFRLGLFPPDHHVAPAAPTPAPTPSNVQSKP
jgi:hypothetical protein